MNEVTKSAAGWSVTTASVRGAAHERDGRPNQDAVASAVVGGADPALIVAVADGHGGARYLRSDAGSSIAVSVATEVLGDWWSDQASTSERARRATLSGRVLPDLVERWRTEVAAHLTATPFTDEERAAQDNDLDADIWVSYGATLLAVVLALDSTASIQLGDGDIVGAGGGRAPRHLVEDDDRLIAGATTSLCLRDAARDFRISITTDPMELVLLSTDGYANAFADGDWYVQVCADLTEQVTSRGLGPVAGELEGWLESSARVGGDDVTVALATRPLVAPRVAEADPVRSHAASAPRDGKRTRIVGVAVFVAVALAAVGAIGFAVGRQHADQGRAVAADGGPVVTAEVTTTTEAAPRNILWAVDGSGVSFTADRADPTPRQEAATDPVAAVNQMTIGSTLWQLSGSTLSTNPIGNTKRRHTVPVPGGAVTALGFFDGLVWVTADGGRALVAIDPDSEAVVSSTEVVGSISSPSTSASTSAPTTITRTGG